MKEGRKILVLSLCLQTKYSVRSFESQVYIINTQIPNYYKSKGTQVMSQNHEAEDLFSLTEFTGINTDSS